MEHKDYRQDEREEAAFQRYESERDKEAFVQGAAWADKHPKKGQISLNKALEWLEPTFERLAGYYGKKDLIDGFVSFVTETDDEC